MTRRIAVVIVTWAIIISAAAAHADDVKFPEIKEGKVIQDGWYGIFAEGKKIGYSNTKITEVKYEDKDCLLIESMDLYRMTVGDKVIERQRITRSLVTKGTNAPVYYSADTTAPKFKLSELAKFEQTDKGWTVTVVTTLNDKSATDTVNVENNPDLCLGDALPYFYGQKMLKDKKNVDFNYINFTMKATERMSYKYKGEETEDEGDKARTFNLVEAGTATLWYGHEGKVERSDDMGQDMLLTDEKTAKNLDAKWDGYKAPAYLADDILTVAPAGVKIHRPAPQYIFATMFDKNIFVVMDPVNEIGIFSMFFSDVPAGTDYNDALTVLRPILKSAFEFGEGKMIDIGKTKCLSGNVTTGAGLEAGTGKYYMIIHDGEMLLLMGVGAGDGYAAVEKDITKWIESIEFIKPVYDESRILVTDKAASVTYKVPNPAWVNAPNQPQQHITSMMAHIWTRSAFYVQVLPTQPGLTADALVAQISQGKQVRDHGDTKVGKYDAKYVETEDAQEGRTLVMRYVIITRDKDVVVLGTVATKENWEKVKSEIESIQKSVEFTEEEPEP